MLLPPAPKNSGPGLGISAAPPKRGSRLDPDLLATCHSEQVLSAQWQVTMKKQTQGNWAEGPGDAKLPTDAVTGPASPFKLGTKSMELNLWPTFSKSVILQFVP